MAQLQIQRFGGGVKQLDCRMTHLNPSGQVSGLTDVQPLEDLWAEVVPPPMIALKLLKSNISKEH